MSHDVTGRELVLEGLAPGSYSATVLATNAMGSSPSSAAKTFTIQARALGVSLAVATYRRGIVEPRITRRTGIRMVPFPMSTPSMASNTRCAACRPSC